MDGKTDVPLENGNPAGFGNTGGFGNPADHVDPTGYANQEGVGDVAVSSMAKTTTISTIAVQSGKTRLVIALLHCGDWIQLKILEVTPELTSLGNTLSEALELQNAHNEVLRQLQNKQSPVEELLRQADQLIATQKPRAEVYAAMAESLGRAWKDVNLHLELRKHILDLNVQYHTKAQEFFDKMDALEASCKDTVIPVEIDAVKSFLTNIHDLRRSLLEALMGALQAGNGLINKLKELGAEGTLDSRPDRIRSSVNRAISQVQGWMDQLHIRRQVLEATFIRRKTQLEQCLALAMLAADLKELEDTMNDRRDLLANSDQLGDSASSAEILHHEHKKLLPEASQLQERAIKITKATEQLVSSGCFAGEPASEQAYAILSATSDYLSDLQQRDMLLDRVIHFFRSAQSAITKLEQLEVQLATTELPSTSPQLATLHAQCAKTIGDITQYPLEEGHSILNLVGTSTGSAGVKRVVEEIENKKIYLHSLCTAHLEENRRINEALNDFLQKQNDLYNWLSSIAEAFLQSHQDMGSSSTISKDFMDLHNQLLNDLQTKGNEINALLLTLPPILDYLQDNQRRDVDSKVEALHDRWLKLKNILEDRLDLAAIYVKFHMEADIVNREMDNLEQSIPKDASKVSEDMMNRLEEKWDSLVPLYQSAKNTGITFINETKKVSEPYLDTKRACACVETVLDRLKNRQLNVNRTWQTFHEEITEKKEVLVQWEQNMVESTKTINWVTKLDAQLYPVITTDATNPRDIATHIEKKLETVLPDIKRAQCEVEQRIKTADSLMTKGQTMDEKSLNVKNKLIELNQKLVDITANYQILLQMLMSYFNNLNELDKTIDNFNTSFNKVGLPDDLGDLELLLREHEASKQAILEMFRFTQNESDQIISRIQRQEPPQAAQQDIDKLRRILQIRRDNWEKQWRTRKDDLEAHRQLCQFDSDLGQINDTLDDLSRQLSGVKGQYGESQASAKATSLAFQYFEKTVQLLEQRINEFIDTGKALMVDQHVHSPHIQHQITQLHERWNDFKKQVQDTRRLIDLSIHYFHLVDEADEWFRQGSMLLISIARKSTSVKKPEEAQALLNEVETFLKPGEAKQDERIKKISELSKELYGQERSKQVNNVLVENKEMLDSFNVISNELNTLARNLRLAEEERDKHKQEQEEANAKLNAMKAEALAAQAAAAAAEEARRAAENAARVLREATLTQKIEVVHVTKVQESQQLKERTPERAILDTVDEMKPPVFTMALSDAFIQEGSRFTFICQVSGNPVPVVTWHKDGMSIQTNLDYQTTFDQGVCTLTIEETFAEDSARYTCKAINAAGSAETTATLSVKETEPEEQRIPPNFVKYLEPNTAREGSTFDFICKVEGNPLPTVQWFKSSECIDNSPDYIITYNNGEAILKFEHVFLDDRAEYTCKASNEVGTAQTTANLIVLPLEPAEAPVFITPLSNVMARAGQKIKLECEVSGIPPPTLVWAHNGKPVKETRELKLHREENKATLVILEAFPKDAGTYQVTASNIAGEATSACSVSVKGRLPTETSDSELASDMEPVKPSIQLPLKDVTILEGNRVRLDCVIVGQPEPEVIWYHDERPVKESSDFQLLFQGDRCSLVIQEALPEDAGEYKVVALNSAGEGSSKCKLAVTTAPRTEEPPKADVAIEITGSPPKFSKLLSDVLVSEGEKVILESHVTGEPRPEVKWLLNNEQIQASNHVKISHDNEGNLRLEIEEVKPEDKGVYTVKASNPSGDAKCFAQLIVKSSRVSEKTKEFEEVKTPPVFKETFADHNVFDGTATKFECIVTGKPTPKVKWLYNNEPVAGQNFLISKSGDRQVLSIPEVTKKNEGVISCIAENEVGKATCTANLKVQTVCDISLQQPSMPIQMQTTQDQPDVSFSSKREVFMQSSSSTTSKMVTTSGMVEPHLEVHSFSTQDEKSLKQINQQAPEIQESHKQEEFHKVGQQPPGIHEKSSSVYTIGGVTDQKTITSNEQHVLVHKPIIKARPPKFITPVVGKIIDQGVDVVLEGILDGSPTPQVTWSKNGVELQPSLSVNIFFERNHARLEIKSVCTQDAGRYTCTAVNEAGTAVSTSDLVVRKTIFPPVFGRRLQAQVVKKEDRLIMEVEVTGTPDPTVTWHRDGLPINEVLNKDDYRLKFIGNSHTLIIEKAELNHSGKYMVRAVNDGGEAQSIADIAVFEPTPDTMVEVVKTVVFEDVRKHETLTSAAGQTSKTSFSTSEPVYTKPVEFSFPKVADSVKLIDFGKFSEPIRTSDTQVSKSIITSLDGQISQAMTSKKEVSTLVEKSLKQESKVYTMGGAAELEPLEVIRRTEDKPTVYEMSMKQTYLQPEQIEETGIQTESISKQSSYDFFVKKLKESEEPQKPKEPPKPIALPQDSYTKFEDITQRFETKQETETMPKFTPIPKFDPLPKIDSLPLLESSQYSTFSSKQHTQTFEEFGLAPEPPPEICYAPKTEITKTREEVIERKKRLEEAHRDLSAAEIPLGAVKIFPSVTKAPELPKVEAPKYELPKFETPKFETPKYEPPKFEAPKYEPPKYDTPIIQPLKFETPKFEPPKYEVPPPIMEPLIQFPHKEIAPMIQPSPITQYQKSYSTTQKTFSHKSEFTSSAQKSFTPEYKPSTVEVQLPPIEYASIMEPKQPYQNTYSHEQTFSSYDQQKTPLFRPQADLQTRPLSPRPSAEAVEMEKLWTPHKPPETERPVSTASRPLSSLSVGSTEPSIDAIHMERRWAHKSSESHIQQKSWPPPETEAQKVKPAWSTQSTLEKKWTPCISTETTITESKVTKSSPFQSSFQETIIQTPVQHYIAKVTNLHEEQYLQRSQTEFSKEISSSSKSEHIIEERNAKPSEIIKAWPPKREPEEPSVQHFKPVVPAIESLSLRPISVQDITDEVYLEPGPPPEIGFAQAPPPERRQSYVETVEQDLEKTFFKEPSRVLPGAVRTVPPPLPPKQQHYQPPPLPAKPITSVQSTKKIFEVESKRFERFPDLEPFPFRAGPEKPRPPRVGPPPTPSKFIKGKFVDSDYESDFESIRIPPKWRPFSSDNDEPSYRRVQPPKTPTFVRSRSIEKEPLAPSQFEHPSQVKGDTRPTIDFHQARLLKKEQATQQVKRYTKHAPKSPPEVRKQSSPELKPGSPPVFVQAERKKPDSPKVKQTFVIDGYMADTDEPMFFQQQQKKFSHTKHEERTEIKQSYQSFTESQQKSFVQSKPAPPKVFQHKKHVTSSTKKELVSPIITSITTTSEKQLPLLEPFPYKPEPEGPKSAKCPPPPSPSKFIKGEFRESDYESDYDSKITSIWGSDFDKTYRPVRPVLTPTGRASQAHKERTPTPPTEFDHPPKITGPARPKFEPIEKPKKVIKIDEVTKPLPRQVVFKPKPISAKPVPYDGIVVATPAVPEKVRLQPGSPPEIAYAPGPPKVTQYYRSTTSAPYHNAIQTETSNVMQFNEATETSRRHVSLQQTTKVIKFGDQTKTQETLEPFPFKPEPIRLRRSSAPPPCKPSKFVPGEFRGSDYESEVESTRIKSKWGPSGSDSEEPRFRRVRAPPSPRSLSMPASRERVITPMEFDKQGPLMPSKISTSSEEFRKSSQKYAESKSMKSTATKIASHHMDNMTKAFKTKTQQFVSDIMTDVKKQSNVQQKPILKSAESSDAQVYREDSRAAQYGTKHVDPNTGLIYFKYDFGYEFGIILPGEGGKVNEIPVPPKTVIQPPKRIGDIEMPVYHENTKTTPTPSSNAPTPQFKPKKFTPHNKNVKWEPTSESEMSEYEDSYKKKTMPPGWESSPYSPASTSPSLPSTSPAFNNYSSAPTHVMRTETPPSCPSTPSSLPNAAQAKGAPMFITPLRDIAVVCGQTAKFECIVQSEPAPHILWSKNSRVLENSNHHELHYRNGVCRLTIPNAYIDDAGTYTCTASNPVGSTTTTANLEVPGISSHTTVRHVTTSTRSFMQDFPRYERPESPPGLTSSAFFSTSPAHGKSNGFLRF